MAKKRIDRDSAQDYQRRAQQFLPYQKFLAFTPAAIAWVDWERGRRGEGTETRRHGDTETRRHGEGEGDGDTETRRGGGGEGEGEGGRIFA